MICSVVLTEEEALELYYEDIPADSRIVYPTKLTTMEVLA